MLFVPSREIVFESDLDFNSFLERLSSHTEPQTRGFKLKVRADFEGEVFGDGSFKLTYGRGLRLTGTASPCQMKTLVRMHVELPRGMLAFGLTFAWGIFVIGIIGITLIAISRQSFPFIGFLKATAIIMIPGLIAYSLFFLNLNGYVDFINEYFNDNFKQ